MSFSSQTINTASTPQTVTVTNSGTATLNFSSIATTGDFSQTNTCGTSLVAGANCSVTVIFMPTATGTRNGSLQLADNASSSPQQVNLSGFGVTPGQLTANPSSIAFGDVVVGQSLNQGITLGNSGGSDTTILSSSTDGPGFSISSMQLPLTLAPGESSTVTTTFSPGNPGTASGNVFFTTTNGTVTVSLTGTGIAPPTHSVSLQWNASTSSVVGYYVYRGAQTGGPYTRLNTASDAATSYVDTPVTAGQSYFYVVTAVDGSGSESAQSNEVAVTIPTP